MKQIPLDIAPREEESFENFHPGNNGAALSHLRAVLVGQRIAPVPIYLWGPPGSGKTHLLHAAAATLRARGDAVGWLDANSQGGDYDERWRCVVLDDVDRYDLRQQETAFNWFVNALAPVDGDARLVLAAGRWPPADLALRDDLRTRLGWGEVFQLEPPAEAERRAVLLQTARSRGVELRSDVIDYILARFPRDLGSLIQLVERIDQYALSTQRAVTIPLIRDMLEDT